MGGLRIFEVRGLSESRVNIWRGCWETAEGGCTIV